MRNRVVYRDELVHYLQPIGGDVMAFLQVSRHCFGDRDKFRGVPANITPVRRPGSIDPVIKLVHMREHLHSRTSKYWQNITVGHGVRVDKLMGATAQPGQPFLGSKGPVKMISYTFPNKSFPASTSDQESFAQGGKLWLEWTCSSQNRGKLQGGMLLQPALKI